MYADVSIADCPRTSATASQSALAGRVLRQRHRSESSVAVGKSTIANGRVLGGGVVVGHRLTAAANQVRLGNGGTGGIIDDFAVRGPGADPRVIQAIKDAGDILPGGGAIGILISVNRGGAIAVEIVFCGAAGTGPGGVGRALYIAD